jgi:hypothetical protein
LYGTEKFHLESLAGIYFSTYLINKSSQLFLVDLSGHIDPFFWDATDVQKIDCSQNDGGIH